MSLSRATRCRLLQLPAELRNEIYALALTHSTLRPLTHSTLRLDTIEPPPLLVTCKQIFREATPIFFAESEFELVLYAPSWPRIMDNLIREPTRRWLKAAGEDRVRIKTITFALQDDTDLAFRPSGTGAGLEAARKIPTRWGVLSRKRFKALESFRRHLEVMLGEMEGGMAEGMSLVQVREIAEFLRYSGLTAKPNHHLSDTWLKGQIRKRTSSERAEMAG